MSCDQKAQATFLGSQLKWGQILVVRVQRGPIAASPSFSEAFKHLD